MKGEKPEERERNEGRMLRAWFRKFMHPGVSLRLTFLILGIRSGCTKLLLGLRVVVTRSNPQSPETKEFDPLGPKERTLRKGILDP